VSVYLRKRRSGGGLWVNLGIVGALAAAGVTYAGGGIDHPDGGLCVAHVRGPGCNPNAGKLFGKCVVMQGEAWVESDCLRPKAIPAAVGRAGDPELRPALAGCGLTGMPAILATIRTLESGGRYDAVNPNALSGATGAYQFIGSTWGGYGGYSVAYQAPPAVQDAKAAEHVQHWLNVGGLAAVPVGWYYPAALSSPALMDAVPAPEAGNTTTPRQYAAKWMGIHDGVTAPC
jgi:hypothetical protein